MSTLKYRFENVKTQIDSFDYISSNIKLKKVGLVYRGLCPFHGEKTPSFTVYPPGFSRHGESQEHASFYCFGCGAGGDVFEFRKRSENLPSTGEALKRFEQELGIEMEDEDVHMQFLKDALNKVKVDKEQILSVAEINILCSSYCRNYLKWVNEYVPHKYIEEKQVIEKFYAYFDHCFEEKSAFECMKLISEVERKVEKRRNNLKNEMERKE